MKIRQIRLYLPEMRRISASNAKKAHVEVGVRKKIDPRMGMGAVRASDEKDLWSS
jgi:hypothetical protein